MNNSADLRRLYLARTGQPFPGDDGKIAELAQAYGGWRTGAEVVEAMGRWAAVNR